MKSKYRFFSAILLLSFLLTSIPQEFFNKSYADSEIKIEEYELSDLSQLRDINDNYNLMMSEDEIAKESSVLKGARIEGNKAYDIPLMKKAQDDLALLSQDRCINLPAGVSNYNPQQFFYIGSIGARIQLLRKVNRFINLMTTEYIYKIQEAHNLAAQVAFESVMVAINPFNGKKDVLAAIDKLDKNFEKIISMRDLTSSDQATVYVKRLMYKNISEARKSSNKYFDKGDYGAKGKEEFIQSIFRTEVNEINKEVGKKITFGQLVELDARLKSAASSAYLSKEVLANPGWLNETVLGEIRRQNGLKSKYRSVIDKEDFDMWQNLVKKVVDKKVEKNPRYDSIANAIYDLWDFNSKLLDKYSRSLKKEDFEVHGLFIPSSYVEPYQIASIQWIVSPTFDKVPAGMKSQSSNIIIGFGGQKAQYGNYNNYVAARSSLQDEVVTTSMDGINSDLIYPDFTDPEI